MWIWELITCFSSYRWVITDASARGRDEWTGRQTDRQADRQTDREQPSILSERYVRDICKHKRNHDVQCALTSKLAQYQYVRVGECGI